MTNKSFRRVGFTVCLSLLMHGFSSVTGIGVPPAVATPTPETTRVSISSSGTQGNDESGYNTISGDGRVASFISMASNLIANDTNGVQDVFVREQTSGQTTRVSVSSQGAEGNAFSDCGSLSDDGRYVAFCSNASNLVDGDTNGPLTSDAFVHDRQTSQTTRVSVSSSGAQGNDDSDLPDISADGRYVAFSSWATNLVSGDSNAWEDVFVHDRETGGTTRVSVSSDEVQGNDKSNSVQISADGRFVGFASRATNLVANDANGSSLDVFVRDRVAGITVLASIGPSGAQIGGAFAAISADGRYVAFTSGVIGYVRDVFAGTTVQLGVGTPDAISGNGRFIGYSIDGQAYLHDWTTGSTELLSVSTSGGSGNGTSVPGGISSDGRYVSFSSFASNLVTGDTNTKEDVFVRDRKTSVPISQTFGSSGLHAVNPSEVQSDPVNSATGSFTTSVRDLSLTGLGLGFEFRRSYTSGDSTIGPLGRGWTHSYAVTLTPSGSGALVLRAEDGQQLTFTQQGDGSYRADPGGRSSLATISGGHELTRLDQVRYTFDASGS